MHNENNPSDTTKMGICQMVWNTPPNMIQTMIPNHVILGNVVGAHFIWSVIQIHGIIFNGRFCTAYAIKWYHIFVTKYGNQYLPHMIPHMGSNMVSSMKSLVYVVPYLVHLGTILAGLSMNRGWLTILRWLILRLCPIILQNGITSSA